MHEGAINIQPNVRPDSGNEATELPNDREESAVQKAQRFHVEHAYTETGFSTDKVIYAEPKKEHKYESLKGQFMPPENYANLYLQILKRESKTEEDMRNDAEQAKLTKTRKFQ